MDSPTPQKDQPASNPQQSAFLREFLDFLKRHQSRLEKEALKTLITLLASLLTGLLGYIVAHYKEKAAFDQQLQVLHQTAALNLTNLLISQSLEHSNAFLRLRHDLLHSLTLQDRSFSNQQSLLHDSLAQSLTNAFQLQRERLSAQWDQLQKSSAIQLTNEFSKLVFGSMLALSNRLEELRAASADARKKWLAEQQYAELKSRYETKLKLLAEFSVTFSKYLIAEDDLNQLGLMFKKMSLALPKRVYIGGQARVIRDEQFMKDYFEKL